MRKDHTGARFGRLTAIRYVGSRRWMAIWLFRCDCGNEHTTLVAWAINGDSRSCGCLKGQVMAARNRTHGHTGSPAYYSWQNMKGRCLRPSHPDFRHYGGRGIMICQRWQDSFENFLSDMGERPATHSLERLDNERGYEPGNCAWIPKKRQPLNTRSNIRVLLDGDDICLAEACRRIGINKITVHMRLRRGWPLEEALHAPVIKGVPRHRRPAFATE
jgi:hypothetical protein